MLYLYVYYVTSSYILPLALSWFVFSTIDSTNIHGSVSRKETHLSAKPNSGVELGSLYRQIEVSALANHLTICTHE